jgi:hypothetical protein
MEILIVDKFKRERLAAKAFDLVEAHYNFDHTVAQYSDLYERVLLRGTQRGERKRSTC